MHWALGLIIFIVIGTFIGWLVIRIVKHEVFSASSSLLLLTGILNYAVWLLMGISTVVLVREWNKQFGSDY
jgi:hypothetical protein